MLFTHEVVVVLSCLGFVLTPVVCILWVVTTSQKSEIDYLNKTIHELRNQALEQEREKQC